MTRATKAEWRARPIGPSSARSARCSSRVERTPRLVLGVVAPWGLEPRPAMSRTPWGQQPAGALVSVVGRRLFLLLHVFRVQDALRELR